MLNIMMFVTCSVLLIACTPYQSGYYYYHYYSPAFDDAEAFGYDATGLWHRDATKIYSISH